MPFKSFRMQMDASLDVPTDCLPVRLSVPLMEGESTASIETVLEGTHRPARMILDSGSFLSVVHSSMIPCAFREPVQECTVVGICNMPMTYSEVATVCFRVGGKPFYQQMAVIDSLASAYILGNDFLNKHCVVIDYFEKEAHIHWF